MPALTKRSLRRSARSERVIASIGACCACACLAGAAPDWPNFRGPNHDGIAKESGFQTAFTGDVPKLWQRTVGSAFSSFAVVDRRVYTCGTERGQQTLLCLRADSGELVWSTPFEKEYPERQGGDGTRATPTVDDGRVYVLGARGKLLCANAADGKEIWSQQFNHVPQWGYSGSVLIEGEAAITSGGADQGGLIAFDKRTGKELWKTGTDPAGYSTAYPFTLAGKRYVVGFTGNSVLIVEAKTGREVWRTPWKTDWDVNAAAPIFHDGLLFLTSGYKTGCAAFALKPEGDKLSGKEVWRNKSILAKFQSAVLHDGHLYCSDQKALVCVEFKSGAEKWRVPRVMNGTLVLADGYLILLTEDGTLQIARADASRKFEPTTSVSVLAGKCWVVPVLDGGRLYARDMETVVCLNLKP